jgi:hypothetical protein
VDTFEHWLLMSIDHVLPISEARRLGVPQRFVEDAINRVLCCSGCNGFDNRYRSSALAQPTWEFHEFLDLRDQIFIDRRRLIADRRRSEMTLFQSRPWEKPLATSSTECDNIASQISEFQFGEWRFSFRESLSLERDDAGAIREFRPQERYAQASVVPLHSFGDGPFCSFRITAEPGLVGVYALVEGGQVRYVGECEDLRERFNTGYGNISPRNCFVGGQSTNCKINRRILDVVNAGGRVDLYFCLTPLSERKSVERQVLDELAPEWNRRGVPANQPHSARVVN